MSIAVLEALDWWLIIIMQFSIHMPIHISLTSLIYSDPNFRFFSQIPCCTYFFVFFLLKVVIYTLLLRLLSAICRAHFE